MDLRVFCKGYLLGFHGHYLTCIWEGVPMRISLDFKGFAWILQVVPLRISWDLCTFSQSYPLEFHGISRDRCGLQGIPLRISCNSNRCACILQGVPLRFPFNFNGLTCILQREPPTSVLDFNRVREFCNVCALAFHWITRHSFAFRNGCAHVCLGAQGHRAIPKSGAGPFVLCGKSSKDRFLEKQQIYLEIYMFAYVLNFRKT